MMRAATLSALSVLLLIAVMAHIGEGSISVRLHRDTASSLAATGGGTITLLAYCDGWGAAYLHFNPDQQGWNGVPGDRMTCPDGRFGGNYSCPEYRYITVAANAMVFALDNGQGSWNNNNGQNYNILTPGVYELTKNEVLQPFPGPLSCPGAPATPCSGHGTCNAATGSCTCEAGWTGAACDHAVTPAPSGALPGTGTFTLLYDTPWTNAYLHYNADNQGWNSVPGTAMACPVPPFTNYTCNPWKSITVDGNSVVFVLTNGAGQWDNNGGQNYDAPHAGIYTLQSGQLSELHALPDGCAGNCSGHGACSGDSGSCTCDEYYYGPTCALYCGPSKCSLPHEICTTVSSDCVCEPLWGHCTADAVGCPTNLAADVHNCGACGTSCNGPNVVKAACQQGQCVVQCAVGYKQCTDGTCRESCPLPGCQTYDQNNCAGNVIVTSDEFATHDWQTPPPQDPEYRASYQSYHELRGHARLIYTSDRTGATLELVWQLRNASHDVECQFGAAAWQPSCIQFFTSANGTGPLHVAMRTADQQHLVVLDDVDFVWDHPQIHHDAGDYRGGQKGAIIELFGWRHVDIEQECAFISQAGYLGVKFYPAMEQVMSVEPYNNVMNPWYFMYQPVSYRLQGRMGTRDELRRAINTCRKQGVRAYADAVINHMVGAGNDGNPHHRNDAGSCVYWPAKNTSADFPPRALGLANGSSPFYTQGYVYEPAPGSGLSPMQEFPAVPYGPLDFHCSRALNSWTSPLDLNAGWLVGLVDINTERENVRQRIADYMTDLLSIGFSGFRVDAAKHVQPEDLGAIFGKLKVNMGGQLPEDFITYLEVLTGGEGDMLLCDPTSDYSYSVGLYNALSANNLTAAEINQIKIWFDAYPKQPGIDCGQLAMTRKVIENDDVDQQTQGSSSRDMQSYGTVLVIAKDIPLHQFFEQKLFSAPRGTDDNDNDYPIRLVLSSFWLPPNANDYGLPDSNSECDVCTVQCDTCDPARSMNFTAAYRKGAQAYDTTGRFTRTHRYLGTINAMRGWMHLPPLSDDEATALARL